MSGSGVRVVLASGSPRRLDLLRQIGVDPVVRPADVDETPEHDEVPVDLVARLARRKADAVSCEPGDLVIAADTVAVVDGLILGKPVDEGDAIAMLRRLSGSEHHVLTGVHLRRGATAVSTVERTTVTFRTVTDTEIAAYVATGEPMDKAGAYAYQGAAADFVVAIDGSETNVIGLPLDSVVRLAADLGVDLRARTQ